MSEDGNENRQNGDSGGRDVGSDLQSAEEYWQGSEAQAGGLSVQEEEKLLGYLKKAVRRGEVNEEAVRRGEVNEEAVSRWRKRQKGRRLVKKEAEPPRRLTPIQKLLALDVWNRSGLAAEDFAPLLGVSRHTLYVCKRDFKRHHPQGLAEKKRKKRGKKKKVDEVTKRAILMLKEVDPDYGCLRISQELLRAQGLSASEEQVRQVLWKGGYELQELQTQPRDHQQVKPREGKPDNGVKAQDRSPSRATYFFRSQSLSRWRNSRISADDRGL
jgi:transposase